MGTSPWLEFTGVLTGMLIKMKSVLKTTVPRLVAATKSKSVHIECFVKIPKMTAETDTFRACRYNRS